jgi:hypothetical protein
LTSGQAWRTPTPPYKFEDSLKPHSYSDAIQYVTYKLSRHVGGGRQMGSLRAESWHHFPAFLFCPSALPAIPQQPQRVRGDKDGGSGVRKDGHPQHGHAEQGRYEEYGLQTNAIDMFCQILPSVA